MKTQSYKTHRRLLFVYHYLLAAIVGIILIGSIINLYNKSRCSSTCHSMTGDPSTALLLVVISISIIFIYFLMRSFALRAQDRAIRAEENFRHYLLTGKPLDARLTVRQVVALRFAPDEEFVALANRAAEEDLKPNDIKKLIQHWKGDFNRV